MEKLVYASVAVVSAVLVTALLPHTALALAAVRRTQHAAFLKSASHKALAFFFPVAGFVANYVALRALELAGGRAERRVRRAVAVLVPCGLLTFMALVCAYVFKVDEEYLVRNLVVIVAAVSGAVASLLLGLDVFALFFHSCVVAGNVFVLGTTFLREFPRLHRLLCGYSQKFRFWRPFD